MQAAVDAAHAQEHDFEAPAGQQRDPTAPAPAVTGTAAAATAAAPGRADRADAPAAGERRGFAQRALNGQRGRRQERAASPLVFPEAQSGSAAGPAVAEDPPASRAAPPFPRAPRPAGIDRSELVRQYAPRAQPAPPPAATSAPPADPASWQHGSGGTDQVVRQNAAAAQPAPALPAAAAAPETAAPEPSAPASPAAAAQTVRPAPPDAPARPARPVTPARQLRPARQPGPGRRPKPPRQPQLPRQPKLPRQDKATRQRKATRAVGIAPPARPDSTAARPGPARPPAENRRRPGTAQLAGLTVVFAVAAVIAIVVTSHGAQPAHPHRGTGVRSGQHGTRAANLAAAWVEQQVNPDTTVSCDQAMCAALQARGFPGGKLHGLGPASACPVHSAVVVVTPAVRTLAGAAASSCAPLVLAAFGAGDSRVSVRLVAPDGAAAYKAAFTADQLVRRQSGIQLLLLGTNRVTLSAKARRQLDAGQVDSRLLILIATLGSDQPVAVVQFGNVAPGASPDVPLRSADMAETNAAVKMATSAYVRAILSEAHSQPAQSRPTELQKLRLPHGQVVLRLGFSAPSPIGLLSPQG